MHNSSGEKVTLVIHSMGGIVSLYFLNEVVTQEWKDTYINAWVTLSGAWGGGGLLIEQIVSSILASLFRTLESTVWLLPDPSVWGSATLLTTPNRTYTANDYEDLFTDIGYPQGYQMYQGIVSINENYPAPRVPTYCFYGTNVSTTEGYIYGNGLDASETNIVFGDGDGVVNLLSSQVCLKWRNEQNEPFNTATFPGIEHSQMLGNTAVLEAVADIVGAPMPSSNQMVFRGTIVHSRVLTEMEVLPDHLIGIDVNDLGRVKLHVVSNTLYVVMSLEFGCVGQYSFHVKPVKYC